MRLPREAVEQLESSVTATVDPTATTVAWAATVEGARPSTWVAGSWDGAATQSGARAWTAVAVSPTVGATDSGADIEITVGVSHQLWIKVTDLSEVAVRNVGIISLT